MEVGIGEELIKNVEMCNKKIQFGDVSSIIRDTA